MKNRLGACGHAMLAFALAMSMVACDAMPGGEVGRESRADAERRGQATAATRVEAGPDLRGASPGVVEPAAPSPPPAIRRPSPKPTRRPTPDWVLEYGPSVCYPWRALYFWPWEVFVEWGADGEILFSQGPELFAARTDGSSVRRIAQAWAYGGQSPHRKSEPTVGSMIPFDVAPDGGQVAFATCRYPRPGAESSDQHEDYQYELALVATQGGDIRRLTANETFDGYPAWSPDGQRLAFLHELTTKGDYGGALELMTVAADGTDARRIVTGGDLNLHPPAWSPDSQRLAFVANKQLYVVGVNAPDVPDLGSGLLRPLAATISAPAWSPDGGRLAYAKDLGSHVGVYTIAPNGSGERLLGRIDLRRVSRWPTRFGSIGSVTWSPDGTRILLVLPHEEPHAYAHPVYVVAANGEGSSVREIPIRSSIDRLEPRAAAWAPDGSRIAVVAESPANRVPNLPFPVSRVSLVTVGADGTDLQVLARGRHTDLDKPISYFVPLMEAMGPPGRVAAVDSAACAMGVVVYDPTANPGLVEDCVALLEVLQGFRRGASLNWSVERPLVEWDGVLVGGSPPRVRELRLIDLDLGGSLSPAVERLADLRVLSLGNNRLTGRIPGELGRLTKLEILDLGGNLLGGTIPPDLGRLTQLVTLDLSRNLLAGSIPPVLGELAALRTLVLEHNGLSGEIPRELGQLANLNDVRLDGNRLTGCVPAGLRPTEHNSRWDQGLPRCEAGA